MKNFQKITFAVITLFSHTTFTASHERTISPQKALLQAIYQNNLTAAEIAVKNGANVNTPDQSGTTPLMIASNYASQKMSPLIPYLILQGANLTAKDHNGCTPLDYAMLGFTAETISFLKNKKAPIGTNALVNAINQTTIPEIEKALKDGATPDLVVGVDPLLALLAYSDTKISLQIAEILLEAKANINLLSAFGHTPLMIAVHEKNLKMTLLLIRYKSDLNLKDNNGYTALMWAIFANNLPITQALIAAGADLNLQDNYGYTALMWAIVANNLPITQALIAAGADLNLQDNYGDTALMRAIFANNLPITQALIAAGAKTTLQNSKANYLGTALIVATSQKTPSLAIVQALLQATDIKDSINLQDSNGYTALMWAIFANNLPITQALIAAGAKTTPQNSKANNSETALIMAIGQQTPSLVIVQALLQATDIKDSINLQSNDKWTPLMWATNGGNLAIVQALLTAGASIKIATPQGQTAWSVSAANCKPALQDAYETVNANLGATSKSL